MKRAQDSVTPRLHACFLPCKLAGQQDVLFVFLSAGQFVSMFAGKLASQAGQAIEKKPVPAGPRVTGWGGKIGGEDARRRERVASVAGIEAG